MSAYDDHGWRHRPKDFGGTDPAIIPVTLTWKIFSDTQTVVTGDGAFIDAVTYDLDRWSLVRADMFVSTVSSSGLVTVQVRRIRSAVSQDMLTTKITIDAGEVTSYTAATPSVVNTSGSPANNEVWLGDLISIDVDVAGTGAKGLGTKLVFFR